MAQRSDNPADPLDAPCDTVDANRQSISILKLLGVASVALGICGAVQAAEIEVFAREDTTGTAEVTFAGPIGRGDFERLVNVVNRVNESGRIVRSIGFDSPGGVVSEALLIGRYIRLKRFATIAPESESSAAVCASACALAWLGGVYRVGTVYVHRSYISDGSGLNYETWERELTKSQAAIRNYLTEIRAPDGVFQKLLATPSTDVSSIVSGADVDHFDAVFDEYLIFHCGEKLEAEERYFLDLFADTDGSGLNPQDKMLLRVLRRSDKWQKTCGQRYLGEAQKEAQLAP